MEYVAISRVLEAGVLLWLSALGLLLGYRILTGRIIATGLLADADRHRGATPERVQLLAAFFFALAGYVVHVFNTPGPLTRLPDVPQSLLILFAGSQAVYLSGKLGRALRR